MILVKVRGVTIECDSFDVVDQIVNRYGDEPSVAREPVPVTKSPAEAGMRRPLRENARGDVKPGSLTEQVLDLLAKASFGKSTRDVLAQFAPKQAATIRSQLSLMRKRGQIVKLPSGEHSLPGMVGDVKSRTTHPRREKPVTPFFERSPTKPSQSRERRSAKRESTDRDPRVGVSKKAQILAFLRKNGPCESSAIIEHIEPGAKTPKEKQRVWTPIAALKRSKLVRQNPQGLLEISPT